MEKTLLVVDDDIDQQILIRKVLEPTFRIVSAYNLAEAEKMLSLHSFSLILLDVNLPDGDGFTFYAKMLAQEHLADIPLIFVTAKSEAPHEVMGFSLGAEDYIVKPVDALRLKARLEARFRQLNERQQSEVLLQKGGLRLSLSTQRASYTFEGKEVPLSLTPVEFKLLFYLLKHEDHVFTREQLLVSVWNNAAEVFERTVDMHVSKLRKKITDSGFTIKSVHGTGYRLSKVSLTHS